MTKEDINKNNEKTKIVLLRMCEIETFASITGLNCGPISIIKNSLLRFIHQEEESFLLETPLESQNYDIIFNKEASESLEKEYFLAEEENKERLMALIGKYKDNILFVNKVLSVTDLEKILGCAIERDDQSIKQISDADKIKLKNISGFIGTAHTHIRDSKGLYYYPSAGDIYNSIFGKVDFVISYNKLEGLICVPYTSGNFIDNRYSCCDKLYRKIKIK